MTDVLEHRIVSAGDALETPPLARFDALRAALSPPRPRRPRRSWRIGGAIAVAFAVGVPASFAAAHYGLPWTASPQKQEIASAVDAGGRVGPLAAALGGNMLYASDPAAGSLTLQLVGADGSTTLSTFATPLPALVSSASGSFVFGRVGAQATSLELRFPDGTRVPVPLGANRIFLFAVPGGHGPNADLVAVGSSGATVASERVGDS